MVLYKHASDFFHTLRMPRNAKLLSATFSIFAISSIVYQIRYVSDILYMHLKLMHLNFNLLVKTWKIDVEIAEF